MRYLAAGLCAAISVGVNASQPAGLPVATVTGAPAPAVVANVSVPQAPEAASPTVLALTPVVVEIMSPVGSKTSKTGDTFPILLVNPVMVNGVELLPAGLTGLGEVVHAKKSGAGGGAGELVLAARYVECAGRKVALRSMRLSSVGTDQTTLAMASAYALGIFAMAVKGKNTEIAAGTYADAKIAADFAVPGSCQAVRATPVAVAPTLEGKQ